MLLEKSTPRKLNDPKVMSSEQPGPLAMLVDKMPIWTPWSTINKIVTLTAAEPHRNRKLSFIPSGPR